ncbi:isocitrate lyase/phosphoenolpyruvate mutase family protein [Actinoplanes sp. GCM10030250]|uniref:isocitrate lyase/PEP mutase family protein n=1 Tax=Actinoplanes sp. GCM10030250 TaxID=3273376 RepID=UPI0036108ED0
MPNDKARIFRALHDRTPLVLPNAWDAASAALIARAGAPAIATTSGGVAWSLGRPDGQVLGRDEMTAAVRRIAAAVDVPVTADIEHGYDDVAGAIRAIAGAGAAGVNIEDTVAGSLRPVGEQAARLREARDADADVVINARTDVFLFGLGGLDDVLERAAAYAEAGADCLFVPGLLDLGTLTELVKSSPLPINAMAGPGGPTVAELAATGVRRISVGTAIAQAAYGLAERAAREILEAGTFRALEGGAAYPELNALSSRA